MDVILEKIIEEKCNELNITKQQGIEIFKSIPNFVKFIMAKGDFKDIESFKSIYIKDLGIFFPKHVVIKKIQDNLQKK